MILSAASDYIPTPWPQRLRRLRLSVLPAVTFVGCVALTLWLWHRQGQLPNGVGEVEATRIDVAAPADGTLAVLSRTPWSLFDRVEQNSLIARLDDQPARAEMATLTAELARFRNELLASTEEVALEEADRQHERLREARRLAWQLQQHRLDVLDRRAAIETSRVEQKRLETELEILESSRKSGVVSPMELSRQRLLCAEARKRVEENQQALHEAESQLESVREMVAVSADVRSPNVETLVAPLAAAITVGQRRLDELQLRINRLEVRAPISGVVCAIHCQPGQSVRAGDPIVTVASEYGRYIVSYVRQEQGLRPEVGMQAAVRLRGSRVPPVVSVIDRVGPQVEPVPPRQLRDPKTPEWGLPVCIRLPQGIQLHPGDLTDVVFRAESPARSTP